MSPDELNFFVKYDFIKDTYFETERNQVMKWLEKNLRKDKYLKYTLTFETIGSLVGHTVLDIGCSTGTYTIEALNRGAEFVTGLDNSLGLLLYAKERLSYGNFKNRYTLIQESFPGMKLNQHDYAIVSGAMDHIKDPLTFLAELRKIVKISALVSFPGKHRLLTPVKKLVYMFRTCNLKLYNRSEIYRLGERAGFSEVNIKKIPGPGVDYLVTMKA